MPLQRTPYEFSVRLPAPRDRAFRWATDYAPGDLALMGEHGRRKVERLAPNLLLLTDSIVTPRGRVIKVKLVHLLPERWSWTNTHLSGPARHSQFLYELVPAGRGRCRLRFTGLQVERVARSATSAGVARRAQELVREDSAAWRRLAAAMRRDVG
jgi:hypothetical protein